MGMTEHAYPKLSLNSSVVFYAIRNSQLHLCSFITCLECRSNCKFKRE